MIAKIDGKDLPMLVDTGSKVTILSKKFYDENLKSKNYELSPIKARLVTVTGD